MADIALLLSKLLGAEETISVPDKIIPRLELAILTLILFGWAYVIVGKTVIALEFAPNSSVFVR